MKNTLQNVSANNLIHALIQESADNIAQDNDQDTAKLDQILQDKGIQFDVASESIQAFKLDFIKLFNGLTEDEKQNWPKIEIQQEQQPQPISEEQQKLLKLKGQLQTSLSEKQNKEETCALVSGYIQDQCQGINEDAATKLKADVEKIYDRYIGDKSTLIDKLCRFAVMFIAYFGAAKDKFFGTEEQKDKSFGDLTDARYNDSVAGKWVDFAKEQVQAQQQQIQK